MTDVESEEVYAKIRLTPLKDNYFDVGDNGCLVNIGVVENADKPTLLLLLYTYIDRLVLLYKESVDCFLLCPLYLRKRSTYITMINN